jgi:lysyl-tRNA synthetase class 2
MPSTVIRSFRYDASSRTLFVTFRSGRKYAYKDVPEAIYAGMNASFSKGEYFNEHVREFFAYERDVEPDHAD